MSGCKTRHPLTGFDLDYDLSLSLDLNLNLEGQKIQIELNKYIEIEYKSLLKKNLNDIGNCGWVNDIVSMKHENQFTRIFRT